MRTLHFPEIEKRFFSSCRRTDQVSRPTICQRSGQFGLYRILHARLLMRRFRLTKFQVIFGNFSSDRIATPLVFIPVNSCFAHLTLVFGKSNRQKNVLGQAYQTIPCPTKLQWLECLPNSSSNVKLQRVTLSSHKSISMLIWMHIESIKLKIPAKIPSQRK